MASKSVEISPSWRRTLTVNGVEHRSALDFKMTDKDYEAAYRSLGETEGLRRKALEIVREKLKRDGILDDRSEDDFLLRYLRFKKFDCDKACDVVKKVVLMRIKKPELYALPTNLSALLDLNFCGWLPYRSEEGHVLFNIDFRNWRLKDMSLEDMITLANAQSDIICASPSVQVHGTIGIWNTEGVTTEHVAHVLSPQNLLLLSTTFQSLHPWRIKKIVVINTNTFIRASYKAISWILQKKVRDRIVLLGSDLTELHQHVPPRLLPKAYGGALDEDECSITEVVMKNLPYLESFRRVGKSQKNGSSSFGFCKAQR